MKKLVSFSIIFLSFMAISFGQRYVTRNGTIRFYSEAPLENIEATSRQVSSALDAGTGEFVFQLPIRSFQFEKALMQEHFNENYMESHEYPNASFKGKINNIDDIDFSKPGVYDVEVEGDLTIRGITHPVVHPGTIEVQEGKVAGKSTFMVLLKDYNIEVPAAVADNISEEIEVNVDVLLEEL